MGRVVLSELVGGPFALGIATRSWLTVWSGMGCPFGSFAGNSGQGGMEQGADRASHGGERAVVLAGQWPAQPERGQAMHAAQERYATVRSSAPAAQPPCCAARTPSIS